jgi:hypothetical protein
MILSILRMSMWIMKNDILHTTNFGFGKVSRPLISFDEFLLDICILPENQFNLGVKDLYDKEISKLPVHMKSQAVATIVKYRKNYAFYQARHRNSTL